MTAAAIELIAVGDVATREAARHLIAEYLRWIASAAAASYGLSFDVDAMVTSDLEDRSKFYPPGGRFYVIRRGESHVGVGCLKRLTPSGAEAVRLESLKFLSAAHALYKSAGFVEITPYAENSMTKYQPGDALDNYR